VTLRFLFDARRGVGGVRHGLTLLARIGAVAVYADAPADLIGDSDALILGWAFRRHDDQPCCALTRAEIDLLRASDGAWASEHLWGNFLLAWTAADGSVAILRSAITGPALYFTADGACAFTDIALAQQAGLATPALDPGAIDAQLRYPLLRGAGTGRVGVQELLPGQRLQLVPGPQVRTIWSPWDHVACPPVPADPDRLRRTVMSVTGAWAKRFARVQLELSGGLDSSIVAACLARTRADWRGATLVTPRPDGDERLYAAAVSDHLGGPLVEVMASAEAADPLAPLRNPRVRPGGFGLIGGSDRLLLSAARDFGAEAIFTGVGGDNIFGYLTSAAPVVDAWRFAGAGAALRAARDLGRLTDTNIFEALRFAARRMLSPPPLWPRDTRFLTQRFAAEPEHPWFAGATAASDGQRAYVGMLMRILPFLDGYDRALQLPMIAPLLAQPLVEYGLAVPAWQWSQGGHDRSLARDAFRSDLPPLVLERRTKGRLESLFVPAYNAHRAHLGAFLCEGLLASLGVIDCDAIVEAVVRPASVLDTDYVRILQIADIERWAQSAVGEGGGGP